MSLEHHLKPEMRLDQQYDNSKNDIFEFIKPYITVNTNLNILEVGCGEGGVIKPFAEAGCNVLGVDLSLGKIENAKRYLQEQINNGNAEFSTQNIYEEDFLNKYKNSFDFIILKDTIEHIPEQEKFMPYLQNFLKPKGYIFLGFPPWCMPFGGHQQVLKSKIASKLPYYHILPKPIYKFMLKSFGESDLAIESLMEIKDTRISTYRFEKICKQANYEIVKRTIWFINPIYKYKFGFKARKQLGIVNAIPGFRDFVSTCAYYLIQSKK